MNKKTKQRLSGALDKALAPPRKRPLDELLSEYDDGRPQPERQKVEKPQSSTVPKIGIPKIGIPKSGIPKIGTAPEIDTSKGFLAVPHDMLDRVMSRLKPSEQVVLLRLYRLSRGFGRDFCSVGYVALARSCNITRNTARAALKTLIEKGFIECVSAGAGAEDSTYRINLPSATVPKIGIPEIGIPEIDGGVPDFGMPEIDPIKENKKEINKKITHTQPGVRALSRFTLEECRKYADHLRATGQGIQNPGGYATTIHRTGEADDLIDAWLRPALDIDQCPDCKGQGVYYPDGFDKGAKKCRHEKLRERK